MSIDHNQPDAEAAEARRRELKARIRALESRLRGTNRKVSYAEIRDEFPNIAEAFFRGRDLRVTDLSNSDLSFIDFRGSDLSGCEFAGATIRGARFEFSKVSRDQLCRAQDWDVFCRNWQADPVNRDGEPLDHIYFRRMPGERYSLSPQLPELVGLDFPMLGGLENLSAEENDLFATGRLAIALQPVTNAEFAAAVKEDGLIAPDSRRNPRDKYSVLSYLTGVNRDPVRFGLPPGSVALLPGKGLMYALARQSSASPNAAQAVAATDVSASDLAVGCAGPEFVDLGDSAGEKVGIVSNSGGRSGNPALTPETTDRPALLRPLFALGS